MSESKDKTKAASKPGPLIYVVDDEPMLLELALVILQPDGYEVQTFRDPEFALKTFKAAESRPALVITDYAMHKINGMELVDKLRQLQPGLKIMLVSGTVGEDVFGEASEKPDCFLAKPYQAATLTRMVRELLK